MGQEELTCWGDRHSPTSGVPSCVVTSTARHRRGLQVLGAKNNTMQYNKA